MTRRIRRPCPAAVQIAAVQIAADLAVDIAQARYDRTRSHKAKMALDVAVAHALAVGPVRRLAA